MPHRTKLVAATAALTLTQVAHLVDVLRYDDSATIRELLTDPPAALGITLAGIAFAALVMKSHHARVIAAIAGGSVGTGFILYHGIPVDLGANNPYWGSGTADLIQWATVIAAITAGATTLWLAASDTSTTPAPTSRR
jgi:hypothetical protein